PLIRPSATFSPQAGRRISSLILFLLRRQARREFVGALQPPLQLGLSTGHTCRGNDKPAHDPARHRLAAASPCLEKLFAIGILQAKDESRGVKSGRHFSLHECGRIPEHFPSLDACDIRRRRFERFRPGFRCRLEFQNALLYVKINDFATQFRIGATNLTLRISRSAVLASASSLVVFETTRVAVTRPLASTFASTVTRPCAPPSENDGVGVLAIR